MQWSYWKWQEKLKWPILEQYMMYGCRKKLGTYFSIQMKIYLLSDRENNSTF